MGRNGWIVFSILLLGAGCAADKTGKTAGNQKGTDDDAGMGGAAGSGNGNFGNPDDQTAGLGGSDLGVDAGPQCEVGKFCAPTEPDPTDCGSLKLTTDVKEVKKPGNVLVIFDRSGSMDADWDGKPRYQSAGDALISAIDPLKDLLTVGGIFFPSLDEAAAGGCTCNWADLATYSCCFAGAQSSCVVTTIDKPDQIDFRPATDFIAELPNQWRLQNAGGTPLQGGVDRAAEALMGKTFADPLTIVILTDGQPNCGTDQQKVLDQVAAWTTQGIKTHVVGLPGSEGAKDLLNQLAAAGGGSAMYIDPADPTELETRLGEIFTSTIRSGFDSCTIRLDPKADAPEKLHLVVVENGKEQDVPHDLSKDATWTINTAGDTVELEGQLCDWAKEGKFESMTFKYGCVDLPPLEPPPPPE